ncbi:glycyl radical enzyme, PFL2/glycerol dehydratase family [Serratia fonticola]|uniref:Glycyl radical enzyme, PFL2/glycerol dehydratase family n=1 Tax=Serratia fonticola TaxID=47917 RepID=A0A4U9TQE1_SERFO|nr:glycyl radical enzyme, PFL2/glycerol dehydratase family [Serratia fonticola]
MAHYSLTPRVKLLAERLLSQNSTISTERAAILETLGGDVAGMPQLVKNAKLFNELVKQLPGYIGPDELIIGSQSSTPRAAVFHSENELRSPSAFTAFGQTSPDYLAVITKGCSPSKPKWKTAPEASAAPSAVLDWTKSTNAAP